MNNHVKSQTVGLETTPKLNTAMFFCVHLNTSPVALEDCFRNELSREQNKRTSEEDLRGVNPLKNLYGYEDRLIQRQDEIIKALEKGIADEEQELSEKVRQIGQLENVLEAVCEKFFLEGSPS